MPKGKVYLVGAGPGDPGLLTIRGKECLELADLVVVDYLVNPILLQHARPDAECRFLGPRGTPEYLSQEAINALLVERGQAGKQVVRLKNGDPFLFGRGGEEAEALAAQGLDFEVVPGVTAAVACPAYVGIPITHRQYASAVTIVTGHEDSTKAEPEIDWKSLARCHGTLIILMGFRRLSAILRALQAHGMSPDTPVAVISRGTLPTQRVLMGMLGEIGPRLLDAPLESPVITIIGQVVSLSQRLRDFQIPRRPLPAAADIPDISLHAAN
jgi:uroporphyrinogen III methyltransferase/synthase